MLNIVLKRRQYYAVKENCEPEDSLDCRRIDLGEDKRGCCCEDDLPGEGLVTDLRRSVVWDDEYIE